MKICVIGLGYIGLPTACMFADHGNQVIGVDKKAAVVEALNRGEVLIEENGLPQLVKKVVTEGHLTGKMEAEDADVFIISVPTPITEDKKSDMTYVEAATRSVVPHLKKGNLVILESTSPVGTVDTLMLPILEQTGLKAGVDFYLGHSPERVIPGQILNELVNNNRIAGGLTPECATKIAELYKCFVQGEIYQTDARTAELCKLSENTFRDINIAFANELAKICENLNINVWDVIRLCNKHPRVNIHQPGPGVGGHCIAVDPWFIVEKEPSLANMIHLARTTNDGMPAFVADRITAILEGIGNPKVTILGVTYKPDVDDMRESPILYLEQILRDRGYTVAAYDPFVTGKPGVTNDLAEAAKDSDMLLLGVHHHQFKELDFEALGKIMRRRNFFDTRNFADAKKAEAAGFACHLLGKN